jgi:hypothetical protein
MMLSIRPFGFLNWMGIVTYREVVESHLAPEEPKHGDEGRGGDVFPLIALGECQPFKFHI